MLKSPLLRIPACFAMLAILALTALPAGAQVSAELGSSELRGSSAPRLFDAIAQLRPEWLRAGVESPGGRVVVYLNGRHVGDARVLHTIATEDVISAQWRSAEYVRTTDPAFPREAFDGAIYVATRAKRQLPAGRLTLSLDAGFNLRSLPHVMDDALADRGYDTKMDPTAVARFAEQGTGFPPSVGGTVHYGVRGPWGVAATAQHTLKGWSGAFSEETGLAVSADVTSTEGALLVTRETGTFRAGVGPAYRQVSWDWTRGFCQCTSQQSSSSGALGAAAEALLALPLSQRVFPTFRVLARYYPSQSSEYEPLGEPLDVSGFVVTMGVGLATRF
jgi:hypothetical protein